MGRDFDCGLRGCHLPGVHQHITVDDDLPTKTRPGDQPLPTRNDLPAVQDLVIADIEARKRVGLERYGTLLQPHNGRDTLRDAYEEALDLAVYLRGLIEERDTAPASIGFTTLTKLIGFIAETGATCGDPFLDDRWTPAEREFLRKAHTRAVGPDDG